MQTVQLNSVKIFNSLPIEIKILKSYNNFQEIKSSRHLALHLHHYEFLSLHLLFMFRGIVIYG